ncbi:MAG: ATP-binding protein [Archangium sp.]|nr:ATP-binding protein [Archangium sp.]
MNLASSVDLISASCSLLFAFIWLRVSRAPGWGDTRWLSAVSATAALYSVCDFTQTLPFSDEVVRWGGQASVSVAGLHCGAWFMFLEARDKRPLAGFERAVAWTGVVVAIASLVPGVIFTDRITSFRVEWLDLTYRTPEPSSLGVVGVLYFLFAMGVIAVRTFRRWNEGWTHRLPVLGAALLVVLGVNDTLATARFITSPLLVDLGFLVVIVAYGLIELNRLIGDARRLEQLSNRLELEVEARTRELAQVQRELAHSEKLAAIGQLTAGVAHEINNPAAVVLSNLRYVQQSLEAGGKPPDDAAEALSDATQSTERIVRVVRELNDAGRVASRKVDVQASPCEVDVVVERAARNLRVSVPRCPEVTISGQRGLRALVDDALLEQVLANLLANAAIAVEGQAAPELEVSVSMADQRVHLTVRDNGPGVSEQALPHLFEPFFTTRPQGKGTGLGLPVSLGLISSQGGELRLLDTSPQGARFQVSVPRA